VGSTGRDQFLGDCKSLGGTKAASWKRGREKLREERGVWGGVMVQSGEGGSTWGGAG